MQVLEFLAMVEDGVRRVSQVSLLLFFLSLSLPVGKSFVSAEFWLLFMAAI